MKYVENDDGETLNICDFNQAVAAAYADTAVRTIIVAQALDIPVFSFDRKNVMTHGSLKRGYDGGD